MIHTIKQFGWTARIVWETLNQNGHMRFGDIQEYTKLRPYEISIAIGWLARENKIRFQEDKYFLSDTNLTSCIGTNAGIIWQVLYQQGASDIEKLSEQSQLPSSDIYAAIGWLARENKINLRMKQS